MIVMIANRAFFPFRNSPDLKRNIHLNKNSHVIKNIFISLILNHIYFAFAHSSLSGLFVMIFLEASIALKMFYFNTFYTRIDNNHFLFDLLVEELFNGCITANETNIKLIFNQINV